MFGQNLDAYSDIKYSKFEDTWRKDEPHPLIKHCLSAFSMPGAGLGISGNLPFSLASRQWQRSSPWSRENLPEASRNLKTVKPAFLVKGQTSLSETDFCIHFRSKEFYIPIKEKKIQPRINSVMIREAWGASGAKRSVWCSLAIREVSSSRKKRHSSWDLKDELGTVGEEEWGEGTPGRGELRCEREGWAEWACAQPLQSSWPSGGDRSVTSDTQDWSGLGCRSPRSWGCPEGS